MCCMISCLIFHLDHTTDVSFVYNITHEAITNNSTTRSMFPIASISGHAIRVRVLTIDVLQGYEHDHKDIDLMRLRSFTVGRKLTDEEVVGPNGLNRITELIHSMVPFVSAFSLVATSGRVMLGY